MKLTFQEFAKIIYETAQDINPYAMEEDWIHRVEESIKCGQIVSDRVLNCHPDIYFDQTGIAHYRNRFKCVRCDIV